MFVDILCEQQMSEEIKSHSSEFSLWDHDVYIARCSLGKQNLGGKGGGVRKKGLVFWEKEKSNW